MLGAGSAGSAANARWTPAGQRPGRRHLGLLETEPSACGELDHLGVGLVVADRPDHPGAGDEVAGHAVGEQVGQIGLVVTGGSSTPSAGSRGLTVVEVPVAAPCRCRPGSACR